MLSHGLRDALVKAKVVTEKEAAKFEAEAREQRRSLKRRLNNKKRFNRPVGITEINDEVRQLFLHKEEERNG